MKLKTIVTVTAAMIYGAGTAAASLEGVHTKTDGLQGLKLSESVLKQRQESKGTNERTASAAAYYSDSQKVNRHILNSKPREKFVPETGLTGRHTYIVRLKDQPVATYDGRLKAYEATSLKASKNSSGVQASSANRSKLFAGNHVDSNVQKYQTYLKNKQLDFIAKASSAGLQLDLRHQYTNAINAISVNLTQREAESLASMAEVVQITRSENKELLTDVGPQHIGADKVWSGEATGEVPFKGEGMIVGIIDSGINTDHPSFAAVGGDGYQHVNPLGEGVYLGDCLLEGFESMCNDKLIGVRTYDVITDSYDADEFQDPDKPEWVENELIAPKVGEDFHGHGSHVASTAAGNVIKNAPLTVTYPGLPDGRETGFEFEQISGVAPHANIVSYQVCFPANGSEVFKGCPDESILAAIDDAIADGVDSINFSIGGSEKFPWDDPTELAFLAAREAGINVAVAAGNAGGYYISHTAPWENVVAASFHGRNLTIEGKSVAEMSGGDTTPPSTLQAQGISEAYTGSIVLASNFGDGLCLEPFPAGTFTGEIVVCSRGDTARVTKAENVLAGGAGGFILYNRDMYGDESNLSNDAYPLPGAHIDYNNGNSLVSWLSSGTGHMATITESSIETSHNEYTVDSIADFSSRGPSRTYRHHFVPSISGPGVDVFAAYADELPFVNDAGATDWAFLSGTSMASPHVAGAITLMQQAKPEWTPTEIQSAIQMTAGQAMTLPNNEGERQNASHYDAGAGIINIDRALRTGLIMDESVEGFIAANPYNGGDPRNMNLPQVLDMTCKQTCNWVRTVKATRDATWKVSTETGEFSVGLKVYPEEFTLKAGEIQTILVQGEILDSQNQMGNSELEVHAKIVMTPDNEDIPVVHWPAAMRFDHGDLPERVNILAHRNDGKETIGNLVTGKVKEFTPRVYKPALAEISTFSIPQDTNRTSPINDGEVTDADHVIWMDVPANAKRLMAEVLERTGSTAEKDEDKGIAGMLVGYDMNNDGVVQPQEEAICWSNAAYENNWCNINEPTPGKYWVLIHNFPNDSGTEVIDTYTVASAIVTGEIAADMNMSGPDMTDGMTPYDVELMWDMESLTKGDIYYSAFDLGTDSENAGNLGLVPVRLERGDNEVSVATSQTQAKPGDMVYVSVNVLANQTGGDRDFDISTVLPEGATLVPDSVWVASTQDTEIVESENGFTVTGTQFSSADWQREYAITTNLDDPMCRTPNVGAPSDTGGYIDLLQHNIYPSIGGHNQENVVITFDELWYEAPEFALYNNHQYAASNFVEISPMGYMKFDDFPLFFPVHLPFPYNSFPDQLIGAFWKGGLFGEPTLGTPLNITGDEETTSGITVATTNDKLIVEWDNARSQTFGGYDWVNDEYNFDDLHGDSYDFEIILSMDTRYHKGEYEIIMAYDNIEYGIANSAGSIGVQGYHGPRSYFSPIYGYLGSEYAFNDLQDKVQDDLIVCYDYVGPEASQFSVNFQIRVNEEAAGKDLTLDFTNNIVGMNDASASGTIAVPSSIKVGAINDKTIAEDSVLENIMVVYSDSDQGANTISVTGANITGTVTGHETGSMIDITPDANFSGETDVTITVTDNLYPTNAASTTFTPTANTIRISKTDTAERRRFRFFKAANTKSGAAY